MRSRARTSSHGAPLDLPDRTRSARRSISVTHPALASASTALSPVFGRRTTDANQLLSATGPRRVQARPRVPTLHQVAYDAEMDRVTPTRRDPGVRRRLTMNPPGLFPFALTRLFDHESDLLSPYLQPIEVVRDVELRIPIYEKRLALPRVFLYAELAFGRTSTRFDPYKGSFRFAVWLSATRGEVPVRYSLTLQDHRGSIELSFSRFEPTAPDPYRPPIAPLDGELSRNEINRMTDTLLTFLALGGEAMMARSPSFYRRIEVDCVVYGCRSGEAFERCFDSEEAYEQALKVMAADFAEDECERDRACIESLLDELSGYDS